MMPSLQSFGEYNPILSEMFSNSYIVRVKEQNFRRNISISKGYKGRVIMGIQKIPGNTLPYLLNTEN